MTRLTVKDTVDALVAAGGTLYASNTLIRPTSHMVSFPRKVGTPCQCNQRPPPLHVYVYDGDNSKTNVEFLITGQFAGRWTQHQLYSVSREEAVAFVPVAMKVLGATWEACCAALS